MPHARDETLWSESLAAKYRDGPPTVMFLGTPADHKGLDLLLEAWNKVRHPNARLQVIGMAADENPFALQVSQSVRSRIDFMKSVDYSKVPAILSSATVVAIPKRDGRAAAGNCL